MWEERSRPSFYDEGNMLYHTIQYNISKQILYMFRGLVWARVAIPTLLQTFLYHSNVKSYFSIWVNYHLDIFTNFWNYFCRQCHMPQQQWSWKKYRNFVQFQLLFSKQNTISIQIWTFFPRLPQINSAIWHMF